MPGPIPRSPPSVLERLYSAESSREPSPWTTLEDGAEDCAEDAWRAAPPHGEQSEGGHEAAPPRIGKSEKDMATLMRAFDECLLFDSLPQGTTRALAGVMREEVSPPHQSLIRDGCNWFYIVVEGTVNVFQTNQPGGPLLAAKVAETVGWCKFERIATRVESAWLRRLNLTYD